MAFTDMNEVEEVEEGDVGEQMPEDGSSNRTFIIVAAVLGGIMLLALLCTAGYALFVLPKVRTDRQSAAATANAQSTMIAYENTQAAIAMKASPTPKPTQEIKPTATNTPVLANPEGAKTATPTTDGAAATSTALQATIQAAQTQQPTATRLPASGFAEDVGAPGLLAIGLVLIVVIFLVRRLRHS
jgi:hypothetical protein